MMSKIDYEILEDGTVTVTTGDLSGPNHLSADKLLKKMCELVGGAVDTKKRSRLSVGMIVSHPMHQHAHDGHTH